MLEKLKKLPFSELEALRNFFYDEIDLAEQEVGEVQGETSDALQKYQARYDAVRQAMEAKFNAEIDSDDGPAFVTLDLN